MFGLQNGKIRTNILMKNNDKKSLENAYRLFESGFINHLVGYDAKK